MRRFIAALAEGEITTDDFTILAWLGIVGDWHGKLPELHTALGWPHSTSHLSKLLRGLREAGWIEYTARERSRAPFDLTLAAAVAAVANPHGQDDCASQAPQPGRTTPLDTRQGVAQQGVALDELNVITQHSPLDIGTWGSEATGQHSSVIGAPERVDESKDWEAERRARPQAQPEDWAALVEDAVAEAEAEREAAPAVPFDSYEATPSKAWRPPTADVLEQFQPYHGDERTGEAPGDDEAAQVWLANANPIKTRQQKRRQRD